MTKKTILLTGAGGSGTIFMIKSLKKKYRVIAVDSNKYSAGLYFADKGFVVPLCLDPLYLKKMDQIIKKEKVDVIIPLIDEELSLFKKRYKGRKDVKILSPDENFINLCLNKWNLMKALSQEKIGCPKTYLLKEFHNNLFPCIIKPIKSRGSRGFQHLKNKADLENYLKNSQQKPEELIIQEALKGTEFTVSAVVSEKGDIVSVVPKEIILKKGITKIAITRKNPKINEICERIQQKFKANGPFNVQLIIDERDNSPKIFEINPRFSTTVSLTMAAGVNEPDLLIRDLFGEKIPKVKFKENLVMIRYDSQLCFEERKQKQFAFIKKLKYEKL